MLLISIIPVKISIRLDYCKMLFLVPEGCFSSCDISAVFVHVAEIWEHVTTACVAAFSVASFTSELQILIYVIQSIWVGTA